MKNLLAQAVMAAGLAALVSVPAFAQSAYPKAEVFGGFSILSVDAGNREQFYGFQASVAGNIHTSVGFVADFGGQYKTIDSTTVHVYEYIFGPRFTMRSEKASVFAEALFGGITVGGGGSSDTGFLMGFGAGVDVNAGKRVAVRIVQFDWLPDHIGGEWSWSEFRVGFGIVFKM